MNISSSNTRWRTAIIASVTFALAAVLLVLAGCSSSTPDAKQLYETKCSSCHSLETVDKATYSGEEQWKEIVDRMQAMTTTISDDEAKQITDYLANR